MCFAAGQPVTAEARIRPLRPSDFGPVIAVIDEWWGGRAMARGFVSPAQPGVAFHRQMGFRLEPGDAELDGIPVTTGYDGPGQDRVRFVRDLSS